MPRDPWSVERQLVERLHREKLQDAREYTNLILRQSDMRRQRLNELWWRAFELQALIPVLPPAAGLQGVAGLRREVERI